MRILVGNDIVITWSIFKLMPPENIPEDFTNASLFVFLGSEYEKREVAFELINEGKDITIRIPGNETKCGTYYLEAEWVKNNQNYAHAKTKNIFTVTDKSELVDYVINDNVYTIGFSSTITGAVGYDGKSAYQAAKEGGYSGTERDFVNDLGGVGKSMSLESIYNLPLIGKGRMIYIIEDEGASYIWSYNLLRYLCIGRDFHQIDIINGNK